MSEDKGFFDRMRGEVSLRGNGFAIGLGLCALADAIVVVGTMISRNQRDTIEVARKIAEDS